MSVNEKTEILMELHCLRREVMIYKKRENELRDKFAMAALSSSVMERIIQDGLEEGRDSNKIDFCCANYCYRIADVMMKAREDK